MSNILHRSGSPSDSISPFTKDLIEGLVQGNLRKAEKQGPKKQISVVMADPNSTNMDFVTTKSGRKVKKGESATFEKSLLNILDGGHEDSVERLAFEANPMVNNTYASVFKQKLRLIPDHILKRISIQDDLVASIVNMRAAQIQSFGRPQPDRFSIGFKIVPDERRLDKMKDSERADLDARIEKVTKLLVTCGETSNWKKQDRQTFPQYLGMSARNAVTVGRLATELIYTTDTATGKNKFHSFRATDAGTIYRAAPEDKSVDSIREEADHLMEQLKNKKIERREDYFKKEEYAYVQVIEGKPVQAFTEDEMVVHTFYPVTDVELDGYPVTPIDTAIAAVTTHINITTHNRLYFQSGRAARGMIIIQSDDVDENTVTRIKQQFQASINNVANSWRMPIFAVGANDKLNWQAIDAGARDMEFQYLSDTNARVIMSAFQVSPEELPGYQHLSRGTNNQALSESNNEYKLEAARDVGIRPLIAQFEDFLNQVILPLLDETLAKICVIKFLGLDGETPEKESTYLQERQGVDMTYDEVLQKVEKQPVGPQMGGSLPLNALYSAKLDAYFTVGEILEHFCGRKDASKDPSLAYRRDQFWMSYQQMLMQQQQAQQQQAQAAQGQPPPGDGGGQPPQGGDPQQGQGGELSSGIDQVLGMMQKSESQLHPSRRRLLEQHRQTVDKFMTGFDEDLKALNDQIVAEASKVKIGKK